MIPQDKTICSSRLKMSGMLLFEKTNPAYPYQATKFDTIEEVKNYMTSSIVTICAAFSN